MKQRFIQFNIANTTVISNSKDQRQRFYLYKKSWGVSSGREKDLTFRFAWNSHRSPSSPTATTSFRSRRFFWSKTETDRGDADFHHRQKPPGAPTFRWGEAPWRREIDERREERRKRKRRKKRKETKPTDPLLLNPMNNRHVARKGRALAPLIKGRSLV